MGVKIIAGSARGTILETPTGQGVRPTIGRIAENLFNILAHNAFTEDEFSFHTKRVLDLCAGSGRLGLEALSRGADYGVFIESDAHVRTVLAKNIAKMRVESKTQILSYNVAHLPKMSSSLGGGFSLVFCDAPYKTDITKYAIESGYGGGWFAEGALLCLETENTASDFVFSFADYVDMRSYAHTKLHFLVLKK